MKEMQNMRWSYPFQPLLLLAADWGMVVLAEELAYALRQSWLPIANPGFYIPGFYLYILVPAIFLAFLQSPSAKFRRFPTWKMAQIVFRAVFFSILTLMEVPVLFVGAGETAAELVKTLEAQGGCGMKVIGFIADTPMAVRLRGRYRLLGHMEHLERVLHLTGVQHVIVTATGLPAAEQVHIINRIQPYVKNVIFVPDLLGAPVSNMDIDGLLDNSLMLLRFRNNLAHWYNRALKRVFDLVLSLLGLIVVLPVTLVIAVLIRMDGPGPIFFAHRRIGQGGREFPCYKFRSMVPDAENVLKDYLAAHPEARKEWERDFKLKDDPRITHIGAFLRKTSLDELPQFFNVLKGDMSLVGPRPIIAAEIPKYGEYFADFCLVPPGITGMWQVNGRSDTTYEERVQMDTWYVRNWSVWIDIIYLFKTVAVVLERKGAY